MRKPLELVFRSVSKIMINNNITLQSAIETLKIALVRSASEDRDATDSIISLRTGVHRKDVKRLRAEDSSSNIKKIPISPISMVMTYWGNEPPFCDDAQKPRVIPRKGTAAAPGFDDLVKACKVDVPPSTVLAELKRNKLVEIAPDDTVSLLTLTFVPQTSDAALQAFDATISDHIRIAASNTLLAPDKPRQFDQVVRYSHLSQASFATLKAEADRQARAYLEDLNTLAHRLQMNDAIEGKETTGRFVSGVYVATTPPHLSRTKQDTYEK